MKTVIRNSYTPKIGDYCNKIVVDKETGNIYIFDTDGVFTEFGDADIDIEDIIRQAVEQSEEYTDEVAETKVDKEEGKGLSSNDFTDAEKEKLESVESGAQENVIEVVKRNGSALTVTDKTVDILVPTKTSDLTNDSGFVANTVDNLVNYYTKAQTDSAIATETTAREGADQNLQEQIDAIAAGSDVVDIVGTYAELQSYDTSKLHNNDIIKVLSDETRSGATTYYRWSTTTEDFSYIGSQGPFYTKSESDSTFVPQTRTVNGKPLSSNITLDATDVGALPNSTVIPTVNDATLTIQKNGATVTTFTANSATNTTANIAVPTKTSDLTNDGADGTDAYVEAGDLAAVATSGAYADLTGKPSIPTKTSDLTNDSDFVSDANYVHTDNNFTTTLKNKLNGIAAGAEVNVQSDWAQTDNTADDYIKNKPSIPTKTSDLTNDSGFITSAALPTKLSDLTNDTGFITKSVSDLTNYYDQTTINNMFNALSVPTKTSDLVNDSGFITNTDYASASTGGVVKVGSGLSIDANGVLSSNGLTSVDWADVTNKPTNVSYWTNDAGYITSAALPTKTSDLTNDSGFITSAVLPTKTSDLTNDSGFITSSVNNLTNYYTKGDTYTQSEVNSLLSALTIPTKTSDLTNDGSDGTSTYVEASDLAAVATSGSYNDLTDKPADFELVEMSYGESNAWAKFIDAYRGHKIVYCRASSNANPASGSQTRKAFMAYVNNAEAPTSVEFQYVRSVSSKTASQPVDQVLVYTLTNANGGTWTFTTRNMGPKLAQGTNTTVSYSNGTYTISATQPTVPTKTSDLTNDSGFLTSTDYASTSTGGVVKVGSGLEITNGVLSATGGGTADAVEWANVLNKPTDVSYWTNDAGYITSAAIPSNVSAFSNDAGYLTSIPTASASTLGGVKVGSNLSIDANGVLSATQPTVGNATLTIQKNGTTVKTFTANASTNVTANITVPTKTSELTNDSSFVTSSGTVAKANQLTTPRTIAISGGATGTATSFSGASNISIPITGMYETYLNWGNQNLSGRVSPIDTAMSEEFSANRLAYMDASKITVEYSRDGGSTWTDYGLTAAQKTGLVTTSQPIYTGGTNSNAASNYQVRVNLNPTNPYMATRKLFIYISTGGVSNAQVLVERKSMGGTNYETVTTATISGWSGWNSIPINITFGGSASWSNSDLRLTFSYSGKSTSYPNAQLQISKIRLYGETAWSAPSNLATNGHLYTYDTSQNATFPANVKVTGSLQHDNYTYTLPSKNGTVAMTSDIPASITVDSALSSTSTNPVQNKVINTALNGKQASLSTAQLNAANSGITSAKVTTYDGYAGQIATKADLSALDGKQDALTAGSHINITNDTISATGYVHSENPVTTTSSTATVTGSMIANGTITADKLATGATLKLTLSTTDIGEGAALAANTLYGVYQ